MMRISKMYHLGRIVVALAILFFGFNMLTQGKDFYLPYLHAWRRMLLPNSKNRINESLTYEEVFSYVVQAAGGVMMLGGLLVFINQRVIGGVLCMLTIFFMLATQDNPMLTEHIKPAPKNAKINLNDVARHLSLLGALLYMMIVPPVDDAPKKGHKIEEDAKKNN